MNPYFIHLFLPVPFMLLYELKTDKLDFLTDIAVVSPIIASFILYVLQDCTFLRPELAMCYSLMLALGTAVFRQKHNLPQALSLAFNLAFFNSLYWEIPIHIYTPFYVGFIDATTPLHFIYAFPLIFLYSKLRFPNPSRKRYLLFMFGILFSAICLVPLILWYPYLWRVTHPFWVERLWDINRMVCFALLLKIFSAAKPVEKVAQQQRRKDER